MQTQNSAKLLNDIKIIIDYREKDLMEELLKQNNEISINYVIEQRNLEVGDIIITNMDETKNYCLWERKTVADFMSSLNDGRYREQKIRILKSDFKRKGYILEGDYSRDPNRYCKNRTKTCSLGMMSNCVMRDNLFVIHTYDLQTTAKFMLKIVKNSDKWLSVINKDIIEHINDKMTLKELKRSKTKTKHEFVLNVLCSVPSISERIALEIIKEYGDSLKMIIENMDNIAKMKINNRRISSTAIKKMREYFELGSD